MNEIRIGQKGQLIMLLAVLGAVAATIAAQLPEIQRYLKVRSM
jgi:uncharacterized protein DUF6893